MSIKIPLSTNEKSKKVPIFPKERIGTFFMAYLVALRMSWILILRQKNPPMNPRVAPICHIENPLIPIQANTPKMALPKNNPTNHPRTAPNRVENAARRNPAKPHIKNLIKASIK